MKQHHWYVASPHKVGPVGAEQPYGVQHARSPGSSFTECGELALTWPLFWDRPFHARLELVCRAYVNSVVQQRFDSLPEQQSDQTMAEA